MGRKPSSCLSNGLKKGAWTPLEDQILIDYININGEGKWSKLSKQTGLERSGKSCRLRWLNYLRPDIKRGNISEDEEELIIRLHKLLGNRWCLIAGRLPGRTDNEIKNYWNTNLSKKAKHQAAGIYEEDEAMPLSTTEEKGHCFWDSSADLQRYFSELLELDVEEFNKTMRFAFGEDFCDLEESSSYDDMLHTWTTDQQPKSL